MFNFKTNHVMEINPLNEIKAKFKQLSNTVIQDLYNVFCDVGMVEEILKMTFPMFLDQNAGYCQMAQMFAKPKNINLAGSSKSSGVGGAADNFWTNTLVQSYLKMMGRRPDQTYDQYYTQGKADEDKLRESISEKYKEILKMKNARRYNMIDEIKMSIHEDQLRLQQIRSNTSEYVFSTRNNESSVSVMIDLHGLTKVEAIRVTKSRLQITLDGLRSGSINPNSGNGKDHIFKVITGAGKHSSRGAVLKPAIYTMLKEMNYEHYADLVNGVFLVRLWKC